MEIRKYFDFIMKVFIWVFVVAFILLVGTEIINSSITNHIDVVTITLSIVALALFIYVFYFIDRKSPESLVISLIGYPSSGKTVFLSVLFREFMIRRLDRSLSSITFLPYGQETTEIVTQNWNYLTTGKWLPKTEKGDSFPFRATAAIGKGLLTKRFKIEIRDFAGEYVKEFEDEKWLHKSKYFYNVAESDVIFFAIDGEEVLTAIESNNKEEINKTENSMIAALNIIREYKNIPVGRKTRSPVGLIFMKWDLITDNYPEDAISIGLKLYENLIAYCKNNCSNFNLFMVTSIGHIGENGLPPKNLEPHNVTEPIEWALKTIS